MTTDMKSLKSDIEYKGFKIRYNIHEHYEVTFELRSDTSQTKKAQKIEFYSLGTATKTIDNWLRAKTLIGKDVIGFSSWDGTAQFGVIDDMRIDEKSVFGSSSVYPYFFSKGKKFDTLGPFFENNAENREKIEDMQLFEKTIKKLHAAKQKVFQSMQRIDKPLYT